MKKFYYIIIGILLLIGIPACQQYKDYPHAILQAESCMDEHPDSALHYLSAYADSISMQPEETRMYYHLLTHQAKDKLYMKPESDSLINRIVAFYDETDDKDKQMLAYYYQGSVYRDLNDAPRALKAFQQVLDLGEGYPPCDLFARTYNQMGTLFAHQGLYDESLEANKQSVQQYLLQGKKNRTSYALRDIARMYNVKNQRDSASHYYQRAYQTAVSANDSNRMNRIKAEWGCYMTNDSTTRETGKQILLALVRQGKTYPNILSNLGSLYRHEGKWDSAYHFLEKMITATDIHKRQAAFQDLGFIEYQKGNLALAIEYGKQANALRDSIEKITQTEAVAKINSLYNYQRTERTNIQLQLSQEKQIRTIWVLSFFLFLSLCIGIIIYFHIQKKHQTLLSKEQTLLKQAEDNYANSIEQVKENRQEIDRLNSLLKENEDKSKLLEKELALAKKLQLESQNAFIIASQKEKELSEQAFMESEIYSLFHKAAFTPGLHLSAKEWSILHRHFHEAYPNFLSKLKELYPNPSEHELRICLLLKMGITLTGIANLLESSKPSITNARARLYERIFGKKGKASDLDKFIAEL